MLKIISGEYRTRRLASPPDEAVSRPFSHRAKEAVFNLLRGWFDDARVLDLFAGVGTMGLEAVSRGAASVVLIERDPAIHRILEQNIRTLDCADRAEAVRCDALGQTALLRAPKPVDVVFMDPPYDLMIQDESRKRVLEQAERCRAVMAESSFLVLRSPRSPDRLDHSIAGFDGPETRRYGLGMWVLMYSRQHEEPRAAPLTAPESDGVTP